MTRLGRLVLLKYGKKHFPSKRSNFPCKIRKSRYRNIFLENAEKSFSYKTEAVNLLEKYNFPLKIQEKWLSWEKGQQSCILYGRNLFSFKNTESCRNLGEKVCTFQKKKGYLP